MGDENQTEGDIRGSGTNEDGMKSNDQEASDQPYDPAAITHQRLTDSSY